MKYIVEKILNEYITAKQAPFTGHPLGSFFRNDIPSSIYKTGIVDPNTHLITGSVGKGNWAILSALIHNFLGKRSKYLPRFINWCFGFPLGLWCALRNKPVGIF